MEVTRTRDLVTAAWAAVVLVCVSAVVFGLGPASALQAMSPDGTLLDMHARSPSLAAAWVAGLDSDGRRLLSEYLVWDSVFLVVHGLAMFVLLAVPLARWPLVDGRLRWLAGLALVLGALDAAENTCIAMLLGDASVTLCAWLETITEAKLALVPVVFGLLFVAWIGVLWLSLRQRGVGTRGVTVEIRHTS